MFVEDGLGNGLGDAIIAVGQVKPEVFAAELVQYLHAAVDTAPMGSHHRSLQPFHGPKKVVRHTVVGRRKAAVEACVEHGDQAKTGDLLIDGLHPGIVRVKMLVFRVELYSLQTGGMDPFQLFQGVRRIGMDGCEGHDGRVFVYLDGKAVDVMLLFGAGGNGQNHGHIHAVFCHFLLQGRQCSGGLGLQTAALEGQTFHGPAGDPFRKRMGMKIDQHSIHLLCILAL